MQGLVTAIYEVGCLAGAVLVLFVGEKIGRKRSIIAGAAVMVLGVLIQVFTFEGHSPLVGDPPCWRACAPLTPFGGQVQFIIGRIVMGVGNGMNTSSIPAYQAETAQSKNRGLLICIQGGSIAFGTLTAYWCGLLPVSLNPTLTDRRLNYGVSFTGTDMVWRFPIAFQLIFAAIIIGGMVVLPESPRWLLARNRDAEGTAVISALHDLPVDSQEVLLEKRIIMDSLLAAGQIGVRPKMSDMLTNGKTQHLRRVILGASSQIMQQIGGCNVSPPDRPTTERRTRSDTRFRPSSTTSPS